MSSSGAQVAMMTLGINKLEVASGIKDLPIAAGLTSFYSLLRSSPTDIQAILGIELYVAKLIIDAGKNAPGKRNR